MVIDGKNYTVEIVRNVRHDPHAIRIIIPVYMPNQTAYELTRTCIESILAFTTEPYELWVIDNNSAERYKKLLLGIQSINFALNTTEPTLDKKHPQPLHTFFKLLGIGKKQSSDGSYANAIGLEIGCKVIDQNCTSVFVMHSDCLILKKGWLTYLRSKLNNTVKAVGCVSDTQRVKALHVLGLLFDFTFFKSLHMDFFHNLGQKRTLQFPDYDVGDLITIKLKEHGYDVFTCANTYNNPELIPHIKDERLRTLPVYHIFDDKGDVFYLHLGRGTSKSMGTYKQDGKMYPEQWVHLGKTYMQYA